MPERRESFFFPKENPKQLVHVVATRKIWKPGIPEPTSLAAFPEEEEEENAFSQEVLVADDTLNFTSQKLNKEKSSPGFYFAK